MTYRAVAEPGQRRAAYTTGRRSTRPPGTFGRVEFYAWFTVAAYYGRYEAAAATRGSKFFRRRPIVPVLPPTPSRPINILAIDGGAMMGVIPARLLSYLDGSAYTDPLKGVPAPLSAQPSALSGPLYESFDLIVGTSTGGLLTAGLTVPTLPSSTIMQGNDLLGMYFDNGSYIFPTPSGSLFTCSGPLFTNYGLQDVVNNYWSHPSYAASPSTLDPKFKLEYPWSSADPQTLSQAQASILITSFNGNKQGNPAPSASQPYEGDVNNSV